MQFSLVGLLGFVLVLILLLLGVCVLCMSVVLLLLFLFQASSSFLFLGGCSPSTSLWGVYVQIECITCTQSMLFLLAHAYIIFG